MPGWKRHQPDRGRDGGRGGGDAPVLGASSPARGSSRRNSDGRDLAGAGPTARVWPGDVPADWVAIFCDGAGRRDASAFRPESAVAIDVGPDVKKFRSCLRRSRVSHLDGIVLTHFHRDHVGPLSAALSGQRNVPCWSHRSQNRAKPMPMSCARCMPEAHPRVPGFGEVDRVGWASWRVLWPAQVLRADRRPTTRVWRSPPASTGAGAGQTCSSVQMLKQRPRLESSMPTRGSLDVAKVPHHGSRRQHPRLAEWAHAGIAVVSVGRETTTVIPPPQPSAPGNEAGRVMRTDEGGTWSSPQTRNPVANCRCCGDDLGADTSVSQSEP